MEDGREETRATSEELPTSDPNRRPSLTERLMNPGTVAASGVNRDRAAADVQPQAPNPEAGVGQSRSTDAGRAERATRQTTGQRATFTALQARSGSTANDALKDARRFIRVRYYSFLASMLLLLLTLIISASVLGIALLSDSGWEQQAVAGAVAAAALLLLIFLQYNPAAGFASAAAELSQLEALAAHLEKSYALWDAFLDDRESRQQVMANEVALAVSSMTTATREIVAAQAELAAARRRPRGNDSPPRPPFPSPTTPDPRRY